MIITVVNVFSAEKVLSLHVVSFIDIEDNKIIAMNECWCDDGIAPQWRLDRNMRTTICLIPFSQSIQLPNIFMK